MTKSSVYLLFLATFLGLTACQSLKETTIEYMVPGEVSFPNNLRRVAIVDNTNTLLDRRPDGKKSEPNHLIVSEATAYPLGISEVATESLAKEIASQNYFDEVIICDSALRVYDKYNREQQLSTNEVNQLAENLNADFIIALESVPLKLKRTLQYVPEFAAFQTIVQSTIYPKISIYIPNRQGAMTSFISCDSLQWEAFGASETEARLYTIPDTAALRISSEYAGTIPVKRIVPHWKNDIRRFYSGGSTIMRDAEIYIKEENWNGAFNIWNKLFQATKNDKKKMRLAHNIALYYEMSDNLDQAEEWATKAQGFARQVEHVEELNINPQKVQSIRNYLMISLYIEELKIRKNNLPKLQLQMNRFE